MIAGKGGAAALIVPLSFYREGIIEHHSLRYINAFYNFYFVLEGLYGKGKTKNSAIEKEFKESAQLRNSIEWYIREGIRTMPDKPERLITLLSSKQKQLDVDGVIELIVKTRGDLHHFQNNPNKLEGTPFSQKQFIIVEHLTRAVVLHLLICELEKAGIGFSN